MEANTGNVGHHAGSSPARGYIMKKIFDMGKNLEGFKCRPFVDLSEYLHVVHNWVYPKGFKIRV